MSNIFNTIPHYDTFPYEHTGNVIKHLKVYKVGSAKYHDE